MINLHSKSFLSCALIALLSLALLVTAASALFQDPCASYRHNTFDLNAGRTASAGYVDVQDDGNYLIVTFYTFGDWWITDTHLAIADTVDGIPQTKNGGPVPGQFPYYKLNLDTQTVMYQIPLAELQPNDGTLILVTHAVVTNGVSSQTAWGIDSCEKRAANSYFPGKNWATYFMYILK